MSPPNTHARPMIGDIVRPRPYDRATGTGGADLTSGASRYDDAVVVRVSPFALVSREADMLWYCTVQREDFEVVGKCADFAMFEACWRRVTHGLSNRRMKRERSKVRRRLSSGS